MKVPTAHDPRNILRVGYGKYLDEFAVDCLNIRTKSGEIRPLVLNEAQKIIHTRLEEQRAKTGKVRAIILKGRQQGASTYTEARLMWRTNFKRGSRAYILAHVDDASTAIFAMTKRFHDLMPEWIRPPTKASNAKEIVYLSPLESSIRVSTAGSKAVGRGETIQFFHGSEVAYWPNAEDHMAGILQAVPDMVDTEIILESTSAGASGTFYNLCMAAQRGESDFQLIFIPWFLQEEYRTAPPPNWQRTPEEQDIAIQFGVDDHQLCWRRKKIGEMSGNVQRFNREYPNSIAEAFVANTEGTVYLRHIVKAEGEGRITRVPYDPSTEVFTAWDLGYADSTAIWFAQFIGRELRVIDFYQNNGEDLAHYVHVLKSKGYNYSRHYLPHDAASTTIVGNNVSTQLIKMGIPNTVLERETSIVSGIDLVRAAFSYSVFDEEKTRDGIEALKAYSYEWDSTKGMFKDNPNHDWTSHAADGLRYLIRAVNAGARTASINKGKPRQVADLTYR